MKGFALVCKNFSTIYPLFYSFLVLCRTPVVNSITVILKNAGKTEIEKICDAKSAEKPLMAPFVSFFEML